jgi:hypothetical protein
MRVFCFEQRELATNWLNASRRGSPRNAMLTSLLPKSAENAPNKKIAEANLHPSHEKRLRAAAEGWLVLRA